MQQVKEGRLVLAFCWAHVRRDFVRVGKGYPELKTWALQWLGRIHDARQSMDTFRWARQAGFDNIGLDLIYGVPGQTEKTWAVELAAAVDMGAEHLSCYTLTLESGTPLSVIWNCRTKSSVSLAAKRSSV